MRRLLCAAAFLLAAPAPPGAAAQPPGGSLSVSDAIRIALENHGSVTAAAESVEASRQRVIQARTGTLPRVTGEVGYTVSGQEVRPGGGGGFETFTRSSDGLQPRVAVTYNVYDGGLTRASVRQASADERSSRAGLSAVRNSLALQVALAFFNQLRATRTLEQVVWWGARNAGDAGGGAAESGGGPHRGGRGRPGGPGAAFV